MEKEYLSIKEFATAAGVSQQAIYKQLNNKLKPYLKIVENKKMLEKSALELFKKQEKSTDLQQQLINMLQNELNEKNKQLEEKDKQIDQLQQLMARNQEIHMADKQKLLELEDRMAKADQEPEEPGQKKWWQKLFG